MERLESLLSSGKSTDRIALEMRGYPLLGELLTQIESRKKCASKLPSFIANQRFYFPSELAAEQATNQHVAEFHLSLAGAGKTVCDMTSGLGIDAMTISADNDVTALEIEQIKVNALTHNAAALGYDKVKAICTNSLEYIRETDRHYDIIFCDPARRDSEGRRTYAFADCTPDIIPDLDMILRKCDSLFIKASPMLDISEVLDRLKDCLQRVYIVCLKGECKEVLCICRSANVESVTITAIDIRPGDTDIVYEIAPQDIGDNSAPIAGLILPGMYLYEPNAAVMKLNCGRKLSGSFEGLRRLGRNTNLYVAESLFSDFPGRKLKISSIPDKNKLKQMKGSKINVTSRNHPMSPPEIRRKYGLTDGGDTFLYGAGLGLSDTPTFILAQSPDQ